MTRSLIDQSWKPRFSRITGIRNHRLWQRWDSLTPRRLGNVDLALTCRK